MILHSIFSGNAHQDVVAGEWNEDRALKLPKEKYRENAETRGAFAELCMHGIIEPVPDNPLFGPMYRGGYKVSPGYAKAVADFLKKEKPV